jgi:hypothetical protein
MMWSKVLPQIALSLSLSLSLWKKRGSRLSDLRQIERSLKQLEVTFEAKAVDSSCVQGEKRSHIEVRA